MVKLNVPKRVTLANGRTFVARYKRIRRGELLPNIVMRRTYTQRAARNSLVRSIAKKGLEYAPSSY